MSLADLRRHRARTPLRIEARPVELSSHDNSRRLDSFHVSASSSNHNTVRKILLATDLSARGDRALARAIAIAVDRQAHLTVLHVFEEFNEHTLTYDRRIAPSWRAPPDAVAIAKIRIRAGLQEEVGDAVEQATVVIEEGEPAEVIERLTVSQGIDLIVTGIAREGLFASRPVILGRTVERLLRRVPVPVLIVRNRPRAPYRHILVTTDFSEPSAYALQVALNFFRHQSLHLMHAFDVPQPVGSAYLHRHIESFRQTHELELNEFLASLVLPVEARQQLVPLVELGHPAQLVREYVRDRGADLVVLGTRGRGAMLEAFVGSTAKSILSSLACDALVVRPPDSRVPREP
jgi:nucleotide-binding universal stress UspA family protein